MPVIRSVLKGTARQSKKIVALLVVAALLAGAYVLGSQSSSSADQADATKSQSTINFQSRHNTRPDREALKTQTKSANSAKRPSNGHLSLSGTIEAIDSNSLSVKVANGQTMAFSADDRTMVMKVGVKTSAQSLKLKDVKKGDNAIVTVMVYPDGTFYVQSVRIYTE